MKKMLLTIGILVLVAGIAIFGGAIFVSAQSNNISPAMSWSMQSEQGISSEQNPSTTPGFYTVSSETNIPAFSVRSGTARCNPGDAVTSGGYRYLVEISQGRGIFYADSTVVAINHPIESELGLGEGWLVGIRNRGSTMIILEVFAVCADLTP